MGSSIQYCLYSIKSQQLPLEVLYIVYRKVKSLKYHRENRNTHMTPYEKALVNSRKEKLAFNRKKLAEPSRKRDFGHLSRAVFSSWKQTFARKIPRCLYSVWWNSSVTTGLYLRCSA